MKLLLITATLTFTLANAPTVYAHYTQYAQSNCYEIGSSSYCKSITRDGQLSLVECYWKGDNKYCRIDNEDLKRVY